MEFLEAFAILLLKWKLNFDRVEQNWVKNRKKKIEYLLEMGEKREIELDINHGKKKCY